MVRTVEKAIKRQLAFLVELDQLKSVVRQSPLVNRSRRENSAEHSWHLAIFALVLSECARDIDPMRVVKLLLLHDIVEIDAGDAPIHASGRDKAVLEQEELTAAERIFGLLLEVHGQELLALWKEFEAGKTPEAKFAKALDRLQPLILNTLTDGGTWAENGVTEQQVMERYGPVIRGGAPELWDEARAMVREHFSKRVASES
ncbi:MAG: HD domain-containing protein [Alphaproteobacteria bacterium]